MIHQYKTHFNATGEPIDTPFRFVDLIVIAILLCVFIAVI